MSPTDLTLPAFISTVISLGNFVGVSLILPQRDGFLFGGRPWKQTPNGPILELTGIGGGVEPWDRSLTAAARREVGEETAADIRLLPSQHTLMARGPNQVETWAFAGDEQPVAIVFRGHRTPPHQPWHPQRRGETCLAIFLAELLNCPHPTPEVPLLIWLDPTTICAAARGDLPFAALAGRLALLCPQACPPPGTLVRLTDSQEALVLALGDGAEVFYRRLAERVVDAKRADHT